MYGRRYNGRRRRGGGDGFLGQTLGRVLFFPCLFVYLEVALHLIMGMSMKYFPIFLFFGAAAGFLCTAITMPFKRKVNRVLAKIIAVAVSLVYIIEIIAKKILQTFYPPSTLGMAAENRLWDYADAIISTVLSSWWIILVILLPAILLIAFGNRLLMFPRTDIRFAGLMAALTLVFHLLGLGVVHLPWRGDLTPAKLYKVDTNIDDQVEQLGLLNMLRLDVKHMFVPAGSLLDDDFTGFAPASQPPASQPPAPSDLPSGTPEASQPPVVDRSPNVMDVDLAALAESSSNEDVQWLAKYFNSVQPSNKNEYTGMFEGYNVIFFTLEGFSGYAIDPVLTPTLYKLQNEGFVFNNFYTPDLRRMVISAIP